jgi:2-amino-4-hydroxy-6-hydroxymethyldihydropteridine diphosphokinase
VIIIALGANMPSKCGPPAATLRAALGRLEALGVAVRSVSAFYRTQAWPDAADPPFINAAAVVETTLPPASLLALLHKVEAEFGRVRGPRNAPRPLDLDLIDHDGILMEGVINLPHPRLGARSFVLAPLAEVAPSWRHPRTGETAAMLLARLPDRDGPVRLG